MQLEKDKQGNVVTCPVTDWATTTAADIAVFLAFRYAETPEEIESGGSKQIQLVLMPQVCLELAEAMTKAARKVLEVPKDKPSN